MRHAFFSVQFQRILAKSATASRTLLITLLLGGGWASAADNPIEEKADDKESRAALRAYLPTIRLKALLDNERQFVADLESWLRKYEVWMEGGLVTPIQRDQIVEELLRARLRVLQRDTDYRDSLDQFGYRFNLSEERRRQMENAATSPLTQTFKQFEEFSHDYEAAITELLTSGRPKDAAKLRPILIKILAESALLKNTTLPNRFRARWSEWKKIDDRVKLAEKIIDIRAEVSQLQARRRELEGMHREMPETHRQRIKDLRFELDLGKLQDELLHYEKQSWNDVEDLGERFKSQCQAFYRISSTFRRILDRADVERQNHLEQSWPALAPLKVKDSNLLTCAREKAEGTITSLLKTPDEQLAGRKKIRHLRTFAESYRIQEQLFPLAFFRIEQIKYAIPFPIYRTLGSETIVIPPIDEQPRLRLRVGIRPGVGDPNSTAQRVLIVVATGNF